MHSNECEPPVRGSVIQRSLIPECLGAVLNVATVPISELDRASLANNPQSGFQQLVSEIIGVPAESILDDQEYGRLADLLKDADFWEDMAIPTQRPGAEPLYNYWYKCWRDILQENQDETPPAPSPDTSSALLGYHALSLMVSPTRYNRMQWPFFVPPLPHRGAGAFHLFSDLGITEEAFQLGLNCFFTAALADERVTRFTRAAGGYDIPRGQSLDARSDRLTDLIETSHKVCLAPIASPDGHFSPHRNHGGYIAALLARSSHSVMTLLLVGTVSVADYLVHYLRHQRNTLHLSGVRMLRNQTALC